MYAAGLSWQLYSAYGGYAVALLPHLVLDGWPLLVRGPGS